MKRCPFCAEEIQDLAIKCKHCGEMLKKMEPAPWYFSPTSLAVAFFCVGPFMLPLIWLNPKLNKNAKIGWTAAIAAVSAALILGALRAIRQISDYYRLLGI